MMTLFWSSRSPYVRKVMVAAHEIGVQDRFTIVRKNVATLKPDDEVTAANPLGRDSCVGPRGRDVALQLFGHLRVPRRSKTETDPVSQGFRRAACRASPTGDRQRSHGSHGDRARRTNAAGRRPLRSACRGLLPQNDHDARPSGTRGGRSHGCAVLDRAAHNWVRAFLCGFSLCRHRLRQSGLAHTRPKLGRWHEIFRRRASVKATEHSDVY